MPQPFCGVGKLFFVVMVGVGEKSLLCWKVEEAYFPVRYKYIIYAHKIYRVWAVKVS